MVTFTGPALSVPAEQCVVWVPSQNGKVEDRQHRQRRTSFPSFPSFFKLTALNIFGVFKSFQWFARGWLNATFRKSFVNTNSAMKSGASASHSSAVRSLKPTKVFGSGSAASFRGKASVKNSRKNSMLMVVEYVGGMGRFASATSWKENTSATVHPVRPMVELQWSNRQTSKPHGLDGWMWTREHENKQYTVYLEYGHWPMYVTTYSPTAYSTVPRTCHLVIHVAASCMPAWLPVMLHM